MHPRASPWPMGLTRHATHTTMPTRHAHAMHASRGSITRHTFKGTGAARFDDENF